MTATSMPLVSEPRPAPRFLTAHWKDLVMLNYQVNPDVLIPWLPPGLEVDSWQGKTLLSVVGFRFEDTRLLGVAIPGHRDFQEVNLRFYVRRRVAGLAPGGGVLEGARASLGHCLRRSLGIRRTLYGLADGQPCMAAQGVRGIRMDADHTLSVVYGGNLGRVVCGSERRTDAGISRFRSSLYHGSSLRIFPVPRHDTGVPG